MDNNIKVEPVKPKQNKMMPVVLLLVGLLVGLGGGYGVSLLNKPSEPKTENNTKTAEATTSKKELSGLTDAILNSEENSYIKLRAAKRYHDFKAKEPMSILLVDSISFEDEHRFNIEEELMEAKKKFVSMLEKQGLKFVEKYNKDGDSEGEVSNVDDYLYQNKDFTCEMSIFNQEGMRRIDLSCAKTNDYNKSAETFSKIYKDLASAKDNQDFTKYTKAFSLENIRDGETKGYKTLEIGAPASSTTVYQSPDGKWHHSPVIGPESPKKCSDFSEDAKKAFFKNGKCVELEKTLDKIKADIKNEFKEKFNRDIESALGTKGFSHVSIKKGRTKGYNILRLEVNLGRQGGYLLLYQTPDGKWHTSANGNGYPSCKEFSDEAKKAFFKDGECFETDGVAMPDLL